MVVRTAVVPGDWHQRWRLSVHSSQATLTSQALGMQCSSIIMARLVKKLPDRF